MMCRSRLLNARFQVRSDYLEAVSPDIFSRAPSSLLELFVLLQQNPEIRGVQPGARPVWSHPDLMGQGEARVLLGEAEGGVPLYILESPGLFKEDGGPYGDWKRAHLRFSALSWAAADLARKGDGSGWKPDILHAHDWPAALVPVYLKYVEGEAEEIRINSRDPAE